MFRYLSSVHGPARPTEFGNYRSRIDGQVRPSRTEGSVTALLES